MTFKPLNKKYYLHYLCCLISDINLIMYALTDREETLGFWPVHGGIVVLCIFFK